MTIKVSDRTYGLILALPGLIALFLLILFPLFLVIYTSFLRYDNIHPITFAGILNYVKVIQNIEFFPSLIRGFIFCAGSTSFSFLISLISASCLSRIRKLQSFFRALIILPWAVPLVLTGFIFNWIFNPSYGMIPDLLIKLNLMHENLNIFINPYTAMGGIIIADAWTRIPFLTVLILSAIESIPQDLYEAAEIDGASVIQSFRYITLPLIKNICLIGISITLMFSFRTIDIIITMTPMGGVGKNTYVVGYFLFDLLNRFLNFGEASALGIIFMLISFIFGFPFLILSSREK